MRIVLDSNVILSAFAARGLCRAVFEVCLDTHEVIISRHILEEVRHGLVTKLKMPASGSEEIISYLEEFCTMGNEGREIPEVCRDPDDDRVIALAVCEGALYVISGDRDVLDLGQCAGVSMCTPRQFWEILRQGTP